MSAQIYSDRRSVAFFSAVRGGSRSIYRALLCCVAVVALPAAALSAEVYVSDNFRSTTADGWVFVNGQGDGPSLTADTGADPDGDGWLRLTNDKTNQSSFVYYDTAIPTNKGLVFTFDFVIWSETSTVADGFALAIFDATVTPDAGGYGGSLGYAQRSGIDGLAGAVAGFGFDEFGNFSDPGEGREGGPGKTPNSIAIRGSMGDDRSDGYEYVTGTDSLDAFSFGSCDDRDDATVHTVRLTITTDREVTIEWKTPDSEVWDVLIDSYSCSLICPEYIKFGYTGGTGAVTAYHEIRNLSVTAVPEPATFALLLFGGLAFGLRRRRR